MQVNLAQATKQPSIPSTTAVRQPLSGARWLRHLLPVLTFVAFLAGWELIVRLGNYPAFILPCRPAWWCDSWPLR